MKLGTRAKYTLRLMMGIGGAPNDKPVPLRKVALQSGISRRYLDQLTIALKNASLIRGRSGRAGGYVLARPASQITVGEIVRAASGPVSISECVTRPRTCMHADFCHCRLLWVLIHQRIDEVLNGFSLADLLDKDLTKKIQLQLDSGEAAEGDQLDPLLTDCEQHKCS